MTRRQVAKRLGKSLATVRRLEGNRLHPVRDVRGVHHFDPDEVEALAQDVLDGAVTLWQELSAAPGVSGIHTCPNCHELERCISRLSAALDDERRNHDQHITALTADHDREAAALVDRLEDLLATMDS